MNMSHTCKNSLHKFFSSSIYQHFCISCGRIRGAHSEGYIVVNTHPDTVGESTDFKCPRLTIVNTSAVVTIVLTSFYNG